MLVLRNIIGLGSSAIVALAMIVFTTGSRFSIIHATLVATCASVFASWYVTRGETPRFSRLMLGLPNVMSVLGALALLLFVETSWLRLLIISLIALLHALYLTHLFFYLHLPTRYTPHAVETAASFLNFFSMFSFSAALFGLGLFTEFSFGVLLVPFFMIVALIFFQSLWIAKIPPERTRLATAVGTLIIMELAIALIFLPSSFYVNGAALSLTAYALLFLFRVVPTDPHFLRSARRAVLLASGLFAVLLATAPWR